MEVLEDDPTIGELFDCDLILAVMRSPQFRTDKEFRKKIIEKADEALTKELDIQTRNEIENLKTA